MTEVEENSLDLHEKTSRSVVMNKMVLDFAKALAFEQGTICRVFDASGYFLSLPSDERKTCLIQELPKEDMTRFRGTPTLPPELWKHILDIRDSDKKRSSRVIQRSFRRSPKGRDMAWIEAIGKRQKNLNERADD